MTKTEELREKMVKVGFENCVPIPIAKCKAYQLLFESDACSWCGVDQILKVCKESGLEFAKHYLGETVTSPIEVE